MTIGQRVILTRPSLWLDHRGIIRKVHKTKDTVTGYLVRADRNFDILAKPDELKLEE